MDVRGTKHSQRHGTSMAIGMGITYLPVEREGI